LATRFSESDVEDAALDWLTELGWAVKHGPEIAPGELFAERKDYGEVILPERFRAALARLNPGLPEDTLADAERRVLRPDAPLVVVNNQQFHRWLATCAGIRFGWLTSTTSTTMTGLRSTSSR
jgi:type I restriction enzyme R subunit